ncbi:MAG: hypothetical protein C5B43_02165 [Verrucomicrobia bacterium]|nr:MAG: hypothetical protein C5B43_02165 [Verrucomicrobiota bacterium]
MSKKFFIRQEMFTDYFLILFDNFLKNPFPTIKRKLNRLNAKSIQKCLVAWSCKQSLIAFPKFYL